MIYIYSVLIQNEKTLDSFNEFNEFFTTAMEQDEIDICKWDETGMDINTAVPDLLGLIDEKEEWRAVIVITESISDKDLSYSVNAVNPYDYAVDGYEIDPLCECEIPIIRLTHILTGIPAPDLEFECEKLEEPNKAARMIYKPVILPEKMKAYQELVKKYSYSGKKPSEIVLVTLREKIEGSNQELKQIWTMKEEINSSEFWKKNHYPSICRFIVYDFEKQGHTQEHSDMFNFWMSVMLLTTNKINANHLQAYRLYRMKTIFDKPIMQEKFQQMVYELTGAYKAIQDTILYEEKLKMAEEKNLPNYARSISVNLELPRNGEISVNPNIFEIVCDNKGDDLYKWETAKTEVETNLKKTYRMVERKLDEATDRFRSLSSYPKEAVYSLTKYQQEDMNNDLNEMFSSLLDLQQLLPDEKKTLDERLAGVAKRIKHSIISRIKRSTVTSIAVILLTSLFFSVVPGVIYNISNKIGNIGGIFLWIVIMAALIFGTVIAILVEKKKIFNAEIMKYNNIIRNSIGELHQNAELYSTYISNIVSHTRGKSFLNEMKRKRQLNVSERNSNQRKLVEIEKMLNKLKMWCAANYIDVDFESKYYKEVYVGNNVASKNIIADIMESSNKYSVGFNNTGDVIESPFEFVTRLEIVREEIYDDNRYN